jgi:Cd2+/Zn2+-exporting ATPase
LVPENELLGIAAAIEKWSQHPLASAIVRKADENNLDLTEWDAQDFSSRYSRNHILHWKPALI